MSAKALKKHRPFSLRPCLGIAAKRPEPARLEHLNSHVFLETNWKAQYARLACEVALKQPISVAVISANPHIDTVQWSNRLRSCADGAKVEVRIRMDLEDSLKAMSVI